MGTWGPGPFDNDAAADFLGALQASPSRVVAKALREIVRTPVGEYIDVDDGGAAWAASELVALAFGRGDPDDYRHDPTRDSWTKHSLPREFWLLEC
jgi:hypothetical protein